MLLEQLIFIFFVYLLQERTEGVSLKALAVLEDFFFFRETA